MEKQLLLILNNKIQAMDKVTYCNTPMSDNCDWRNAIYEAKGRGISIDCFGDTKDKFVLTPFHLGYKFDYCWGRGKWGEKCWFENKQIQVNKNLLKIGNYINFIGYEVWFVFPSGTWNGYLSTKICKKLNCNYFNCDADFVLFVFGITPQKLKNILNK